MKGVTIASGGVLPNIHPELLKKRKGGKLVAPEDLKPKKPKPKPLQKETAPASPSKGKVAPAKAATPSKGKGRVSCYWL